ncbi:MAG: hypothetical protein EA383_09140 [Spirochaetaceae bacterium]|nr:MAG: hypothetical protein EA383_09140 [Spirochaetaceae bacterium]
MKRSLSYALILIMSLLAAVLLFILLGTGVRYARDAARFSEDIGRIDRYLSTGAHGQAEAALRNMSDNPHTVSRWRAIGSRALRLEDVSSVRILTEIIQTAVGAHPDSEDLHALRALVLLRDGAADLAYDSASRLQSDRYDSIVAETALRSTGDEAVLETSGENLASRLLAFSRDPDPELGELIFNASEETAFLHNAVLLLLQRGEMLRVESMVDTYVAGDPASDMVGLAFRFFASQRDVTRAADYEERLTEEEQQTPDIQLLLADMDVLRGAREQAGNRYLRVMTTESSGRLGSFSRRAYAYLQEQPAYRVDVLQEGLSRDDPHLTADLAVALADAGRNSDALRTLTQAIAEAGENGLDDGIAALRILAVTLDERILPEQQEARVWSLMSQHPQTEVYAHWLARRSVETADRQSLSVLRDMAVDTDAPWLDSVQIALYLTGRGSSPEDLMEIAGLSWHSQYNRGLVLAHRGELAHAASVIEHAIQSADARAAASTTRAGMHVRLAEVLLRSNRPQDAAEHVLRARNLDPDNPRARLLERSLLSRQS